MALINRYGIWNNKGGVGKSTITYHLATRYAELNPDKKVLVIDLCPQANASMMLLGGGEKGENTVMDLCVLPTPKTVVGYLSTVIANGSGAQLPDTQNFLTQVHIYNTNLPENLFLLSGDGNLEPIAPAINNAANAPALTPTIKPWVWIHNIFRQFVDDVVKNSKEDVMVFIDTNPAFSIYTELAITASDTLLCPVNADDSSRTASNAMAILLYGTIPPHPIYGSWTFAELAKKYQINVPKIHLMIGNRLTQFEGAATAFTALSDSSAQALYRIYGTNPHYFTKRENLVGNIQSFKEQYTIGLRDFNTSGIVTSHLGQLLSQMKAGYYQVQGQNVQINKDRVQECRDAIDAVIQKL